MGGGRDRVAPRGRSPRGEPPERAGAGRRAEGATTRARGGGCDAVAVAAGGTARRGGFAGASKEAGMGNVDRPGRSCRQGPRAISAPRAAPALPSARRTQRDGASLTASRDRPRSRSWATPVAARPAGECRQSQAGRWRRGWRARGGDAGADRPARAPSGRVLLTREGRHLPSRSTGERQYRKGIVTRMGGNPLAGFRSAWPTRAPVPPGLSEAKDRAGCADQCGV
jgi:hypothetical protein